ncbi:MULTISPECIES: SGNH/GDSL hydrolase family protein [Olivibacter]|jgi:lysophospholipase L1-like esterase|uniref:Lipolytic protein G-D-S-L family n=2 Tax=Sphingobacteriaceae TaxID=84566 RepID=F4C5F4_SPHS2|nr:MULTISPECIES: SGNH/GDSL hydrolase family protein [Olivibacter]MDM8174930.1 SGNH/GDSL hydrolase family protein [Olivibacter sp. 47]QEL01713.1 SGNH/GDSL hydrolase family protein [Olivibacter sp. LS-1]
MTNRRKFIQNLALGTSVALSFPKIVAAAGIKGTSINLNVNDVILFQGDSITDAGRDKKKEQANDPATLGNGYSFVAASQLLLKRASLNLQIFNKGISGNKVYQLADRWDDDCLRLKPNVLSILIGVNDYWHTLAKENPYQGTIDTYKKDLKSLLVRTKKELPEVQLIIGEPFAVKDVRAVTDEWYPKFNEYRMAAKEIANEFNAVFIPYQQVFDEAIKQAPANYWTGDGVHPSLAGAALMAQAWLKAVGL